MFHQGQSFYFSKNEFEANLAPFFTQACALIELAKNQGRTNEKSALIFELSSVTKLLNTKLSTHAADIIQKLISKVAKFDD